MAKASASNATPTSKRRHRVSFSDNVSTNPPPARSDCSRKRSSCSLPLSEFRSTIQRLRPSLLTPDSESGNSDGPRPWYDDGAAAEGTRNSAAGELSRTLREFLVSLEESIPDDIVVANDFTGIGKRRKITKKREESRIDETDWQGLAKEALTLILRAYGPGNKHFRSVVLGTIPLLKWDPPIQILLDALPFCITTPQLHDAGMEGPLKDAVEKNNGIGSAADEIIDVLRALLVRENAKIMPMLITLSQFMPSFHHTSHRSEAFELIIEALAIVPWGDFSGALEAILRCVGTDDEGEKVASAVREKWIMEECDISHSKRETLRAASLLEQKVWTVLCAEGLYFRTGYMTVLKRLVASPNTDVNQRKQPVEARLKSTEPTLLDLLAILALQKHPEYKSVILSIVDTLLLEDRFPLNVWQDLMTLMAPRTRRKSHRFQKGREYEEFDRKGLTVAAVELILCVVLLPTRHRRIHNMFQLSFTVDSMASFVWDVLTREQHLGFFESLVMLGSNDLIDSTWQSEQCPSLGSKRRRPRPRSSLVCRTKDVAMQLAHCQLLALPIIRALCSKPGGSNKFRRFGRVFFDRLTAFPRSQMFSHMEKRTLCGGGSDDTCCPYTVVDMTCAVVVSLLGNEAMPGSLTTTDLLGLLQELLFSPDCSRRPCYSGGNSERGDSYHCQYEGSARRVISGLILAKQLLLLRKLPDEDQETLIRWIARAIIPPSPKARGNREDAGCKRWALDPTVGLWGLRILLKLGSVSRSMDSSEGESSRKSVGTGGLMGNTYHHIKTLVARTGLVALDALPASITLDSTAPTLRLYEGNPGELSCFGVQGESGKRRMVFQTSEYALSLPGSRSPFNITAVVQFISRLVDVYLGMGRQAAAGRWSPNGWLGATVSLPSALPKEDTANNLTDGNDPVHMESHRTLRSLESRIVNIFDNDAIDLTASFSSTAEANDVAVAIMALPVVRRKLYVDALILHATAAAAAMGICNAVLKNAHEHHLAVSPSGGTEQSGKIFHRQLSKVYDLRRRILLCLDVLALLGKGSSTNHELSEDVNDGNAKSTNSDKPVRKTDTTHKYKDNLRGGVSNAELGQHELVIEPQQWATSCRRSFTSLFDSPGFVSTSVLWTCLLGAADNDSLQCLASTQLPQMHGAADVTDSRDYDRKVERKVSDDALRIISFKRIVAHHLAQSLDNHGPDRSSCEGDRPLPFLPSSSTRPSCSSSKVAVPQIVRTTHALVQTAGALSALRRRLRKSDTLLPTGELSSSDRDGKRIGLTAVDGTLFEYYSLLYTLFSVFAQTCEAKNARAVDSCPEMRSEYKRLASQLSESDNSFHKCQIIDVLSVIPSAAQSKSSLRRVVKLSWSSLRTVLPLNPDLGSKVAMSSTDIPHVRQLPHAFVCVQTELLRDVDDNSTGLDNSIATSALRRIASLSSRALPSSAVLRHCMLAQWGLLMLRRKESYEVSEKLNMLLLGLVSFLEGKSKKMVALGSRRSPQRGETIANKSGCTDGNKAYALPGLTDSSYPVFFEILVNMIIASFALVTPLVARGCKSSKKTKAIALSPYKSIEDLADIFGQALTLFVSRFAAFPRRMLSSMLKNSVLFIKASRHQMRSCVNWQSRQPLVSAGQKCGGVDTASVAFLQPLLTSLSICTEKALLLSNFAQKQFDSNLNDSCHDLGSQDTPSRSAKDEKVVKGATLKLVSNLTSRSEDFLEYLQSVSASHNLSHHLLQNPTLSGSKDIIQQTILSSANRRLVHCRRDEKNKDHSVRDTPGAMTPTPVISMHPRNAVFAPENSKAPNMQTKCSGGTSEQSRGEKECSTRTQSDDGNNEDYSEEDEDSDNSYGVDGDWCDDGGTVDISVHSVELRIHRE